MRLYRNNLYLTNTVLGKYTVLAPVHFAGGYYTSEYGIFCDLMLITNSCICAYPIPVFAYVDEAARERSKIK